MNDLTKYDPETGEVMSTAIASFEADSAPLAVRLAKVELDQAISTAKAYPRSLQRVRDNVSALVMLDEETAKECVYALPRGGKPIKGPSVRFAEIVASQYGNCKVGSRVVDVDKFEKYVEAEGVFIDLESGMQRTARIRRKISDKNGRVYNDDMIVVTGNAACAIAMREAILKGVPKALWRRAYDEAEGVIAGDIKTLAERREGALRAFAAWGITPDQIFASLEIVGQDEIGLDQIATLTAMFKAIKAGEQQVEDYFPAKANAAAGVEAAKGTAAKLEGIAKGAQDKPKDKPKGKGARQKAAKLEGIAKGAQDKPKDEPKGKGARQKAAEDRHAADREEAQKQHDEDVAERAAETEQEGQQQADDGAGATDTAADTADAASGDDTGASYETGGDEDGDGRPPSDEEVERAYARGVTAGKRGMKPSLIPDEYRKHQRLFDAWNDGHAEGTEAKGEAK